MRAGCHTQTHNRLWMVVVGGVIHIFKCERILKSSLAIVSEETI